MMNDIPIRSPTVSDFRCIEGTRVLPFDAPVVLIHGSNGTQRRALRSHLGICPYGQRAEYGASGRPLHLAPTVPRAGVRHSSSRRRRVPTSRNARAPLTVGGTRIDGPIALTEEAAKFYTERCYLDQASLGRLLEFYQARVGREESALAKFVNELLGLEKLDALRSGLSEAK